MAKSTETKVRIFKSALNGVTYKYGAPLPCTRDNLRLIDAGKL